MVNPGVTFSGRLRFHSCMGTEHFNVGHENLKVWLDLLKALLWPGVALVALALFQREIRAFLTRVNEAEALGVRVKAREAAMKVEAASVKADRLGEVLQELKSLHANGQQLDEDHFDHLVTAVQSLQESLGMDLSAARTALNPQPSLDVQWRNDLERPVTAVRFVVQAPDGDIRGSSDAFATPPVVRRAQGDGEFEVTFGGAGFGAIFEGFSNTFKMEHPRFPPRLVSAEVLVDDEQWRPMTGGSAARSYLMQRAPVDH